MIVSFLSPMDEDDLLGIFYTPTEIGALNIIYLSKNPHKA